MHAYLQKRGNRYFIRRAVPTTLREYLGRKEITKALGTGDYRTAALLCRKLSRCLTSGCMVRFIFDLAAVTAFGTWVCV